MQLLTSFLKSINTPEKETADAAEKFRVYRDFLIETNKSFNLTAITDLQEIEIKHFIDSLTALSYIHGSVADIGTGAGFPGLALKIMLPENEFYLIDSLQKRIGFLNELISVLKLKNVTTIHSRAEDLPKTKLFDTVVSRAVAGLNVLCEYCLPFVKTGGMFIAYKSENCLQEISDAKNAIKILGGEIAEIKEIKLYNTDTVRKLVLIKKIKETPFKYPRGQNKPKKQPL